MVRGWEKIYLATGPSEQAVIAIQISNRVDFKLKLLRKDREGYFILRKGAIHLMDPMLVHLTSLNIHSWS
jgi:hypothetical protein